MFPQRTDLMGQGRESQAKIHEYYRVVRGIIIVGVQGKLCHLATPWLNREVRMTSPEQKRDSHVRWIILVCIVFMNWLLSPLGMAIPSQQNKILWFESPTMYSICWHFNLQLWFLECGESNSDMFDMSPLCPECIQVWGGLPLNPPAMRRSSAEHIVLIIRSEHFRTASLLST